MDRLIGIWLATDPIMVRSRQMVALVALGWLPLALTALVEWLAFGEIEPILRDMAIHVRALISVPAAALAALVLDARMQEQLEVLISEPLAPPGKVQAIADRAYRFTHSMTLELSTLSLALLFGQLLFWHVISAPLGGTFHTRGAATWFYSSVTYPLFIFMGLRFLWHWLTWAVVLFQLARLPLKLDAAHPDRAGGIAFLAIPSTVFSLFSFALMSVASAAWTQKVLTGSAHALDFKAQCAILVALVVTFAFAPLLAFTPSLARARRRHLNEYSRLATTYVRDFRERWIRQPAGPDLLGSSDIQSLADIGQSFRNVESTRFIPFTLRSLIPLVTLTLIPLIPLVLTEIPLRELLVSALKMVAGR